MLLPTPYTWDSQLNKVYGCALKKAVFFRADSVKYKWYQLCLIWQVQEIKVIGDWSQSRSFAHAVNEVFLLNSKFIGCLNICEFIPKFRTFP